MDALPIVYDAPLGCPTEDAFRADVAARVGDLRVRASTAFDVRIVKRDGYTGVLTVRDESSRASRELHGATCGEVASALALALATAIEADEPNDVPQDDSAAAADALAVDPQAVPAPEEAAPPPKDVPTAVRPPAPRAAEGDRVPGLPPASHAWSAGVGLSGTTGMGPLFAPEAVAYLERKWRGRGVRLGAAAARGEAIPPVAAGARLDRALLRLEGCPFTLRFGAVAPNACAGIDGGAVVAYPDAVVRPYVAFTASVRGQVDLSGPFFVEADLRAALPIFHDQYYFRPNSNVYTTPTVALGAGAGLGARFW